MRPLGTASVRFAGTNSPCAHLCYAGTVGRYVTAEDWMATPTGYGRRTYRAYVAYPLSGWSPLLDAAAVQTVAEATKSLETISAMHDQCPRAALVDWVLARDESIRSSLIEGVATTADALVWAHYMDQAGKPISDENDALTLGAVKQVGKAVSLGERMRSGLACTVEDIRSVHLTLFEGTRDRAIGGELRDGPIWVGPAGCRIDEASFVAPPKENVAELVDDLVAYLNSTEHPAVIQASVAHAQFETIHPFNDGNGRTGRALIHTILNARGLARGAVPVSTALVAKLSRYYEALNATRVVCDADDSQTRSAGLTRWLSLFCEACSEAERSATTAAALAADVAARWEDRTSFRSGSGAAALLKVLNSMPVFDTEMVADRLGVTRKAARSAIASLERAQIVEPVGGRRNRRFRVPDIIELLRAMRPDSGLAPSARAQAPAPPSVPALIPKVAEIGCGHRGVRTRKTCVLPKGHAGQHRYHK